MARRRNYTNHFYAHFYNSVKGDNARRWSHDPNETKAALARDWRAKRRLMDGGERNSADESITEVLFSTKSREEAKRRRYRRSGIRVVKPRY